MVDHPEFDPARIAATAPLVFDAKDLLRSHEMKGVRL
jgi:hypothetical protein